MDLYGQTVSPLLEVQTLLLNSFATKITLSYFFIKTSFFMTPFISGLSAPNIMANFFVSQVRKLLKESWKNFNVIDFDFRRCYLSHLIIDSFPRMLNL